MGDTVKGPFYLFYMSKSIASDSYYYSARPGRTVYSVFVVLGKVLSTMGK